MKYNIFTITTPCMRLEFYQLATIVRAMINQTVGMLTVFAGLPFCSKASKLAGKRRHLRFFNPFQWQFTIGQQDILL